MRERIAGSVDALNAAVGRVLTWAVPLIVLLVFAVVVLRYAFDTGATAMQELALHLHAAVFLLGAAWALRRDRHVRVDVLRVRMSPRLQAKLELGGCVLLLLPFCAFVLWISLDYVWVSWQVREASREADGLKALYLVKALIPLAAALLFLQGVAQALRAWMIVREVQPASAKRA
jgi:TRAP-type mannitol/chloroaromatic compound transport system permease small subunit